MPLQVPLHRGTRSVPIQSQLLKRAVNTIAADYGWSEGQISLAIVDDSEIHRVNREFLQHDYPTDVISFDTTETEGFLEGEIVVSADTAKRIADESGWKPTHELLLYVIHGMLHIVGLNDKSSADTKKMRDAERYYMELLAGDASVCSDAHAEKGPPAREVGDRKKKRSGKNRPG